MLTYIFVIAITAEAMSGALAAGRRNMDLFGVALIAFITALGGGTVRDVLLGNFPVTWTQHPSYIYTTIGAGLFTIIIAKHMRKLNRIFLLVDAMGLVAFTIIGCNVALQLDYSLPVIVMSGIITGIFGGIWRDILCNRMPLVLRHELYASVSFIVANFYLLLIYLDVNENLTLILPFIMGLSLRMAALKWKWSLPIFSYSPDRWDD
ncbi:MAG: trimeric intracellular cation channel family protein [Alcaligenaceae bacterium]|nr:trimeric intracellular cation channel family protein [Alcaligenaceae bacterium]